MSWRAPNGRSTVDSEPTLNRASRFPMLRRFGPLWLVLVCVNPIVHDVTYEWTRQWGWFYEARSAIRAFQRVLLAAGGHLWIAVTVFTLLLAACLVGEVLVHWVRTVGRTRSVGFEVDSGGVRYRSREGTCYVAFEAVARAVLFRGGQPERHFARPPVTDAIPWAEFAPFVARHPLDPALILLDSQGHALAEVPLDSATREQQAQACLRALEDRRDRPWRCPESVERALTRGKRPLGEWLVALSQSTCNGNAHPYRGSSLDPALLIEVLQESRAPMSLRAAAAWVLLGVQSAEVRKRAAQMIHPQMPPLVLVAASLARSGTKAVGRSGLSKALALIEERDRDDALRLRHRRGSTSWRAGARDA